MNKKRLLKLADLLEADAKNKTGIKFDLDDWGYARGNDKVSVSCGTSACAVGLAVLSGAFKRAGLTNLHEHGMRVTPVLAGKIGWDAVTALFGIDQDEASFLFNIGSYPRDRTTGATGERYVAKRIRNFVAGKASPS